MEKESGVIAWWDEVIRQGVIRKNKELAFWLYGNKVISGTPRKGLYVHFEYDPELKTRPGFLPKAFNAVVEGRNSVGAAALAVGLPGVSRE